MKEIKVESSEEVWDSTQLPEGWTPVEAERINLHEENLTGDKMGFRASVFVDGERMFGLGKKNRYYIRGDREYMLHHIAGCLWSIGERNKEDVFGAITGAQKELKGEIK